MITEANFLNGRYYYKVTDDRGQVKAEGTVTVTRANVQDIIDRYTTRSEVRGGQRHPLALQMNYLGP